MASAVSDEVHLEILKFDITDSLDMLDDFKEEVRYSGFNPRELISTVSAITADQKSLMRDMASLDSPLS